MTPDTVPGPVLKPGAGRAARKTYRRDLAAWMRAHGLPVAGEAWRAASEDGTRDVAVLAVLAARDGHAAKRLPDGTCLPAGLRPGDVLADGSRVAVLPVLDPETADVIVVVDTTGGRQEDRTYPCTAPVHRTPAPRTAPEWVQAAAADYRDARDAWTMARESGRLAPSGVAGTAGTAVSMYQLEDAEYREACPPPLFRDFLVQHAEMRRDPDA